MDIRRKEGERCSLNAQCGQGLTCGGFFTKKCMKSPLHNKDGSVNWMIYVAAAAVLLLFFFNKQKPRSYY